MLFSRKHKSSDEDLYRGIMERYLNYSQKLSFSSAFLMSDLLRHSLCEILGLESLASCVAVQGYVEECSSILREVIPSSYLDSSSKFEREALLEACMHCIELSIERANV